MKKTTSKESLPAEVEPTLNVSFWEGTDQQKDSSVQSETPITLKQAKADIKTAQKKFREENAAMMKYFDHQKRKKNNELQ